MKELIARLLIISSLFFGLAIIQRSFIWALPQPFFSISLPLLALMSILMLSSWEKSWPEILALGFFLDILSFDYLGMQMFSLLISFIAGEFFLKHWFTNRSLYSFFALTVLVSLAYHLIMISSGFLLGYQGQSFSLLWRENFWLSLAYETLFNLAGISIIFYVSNSFSRKMKPFFVDK
jgi:hypothetical protein